MIFMDTFKWAVSELTVKLTSLVSFGRVWRVLVAGAFTIP
jgi:hypothetical protein